MKLLDKNKPLLGLIARIIAGSLFIYAGFLKATAPSEEFAFAIEAYEAFPHFIVTIASLTMPWIEIYLGVFLIFGLFTRISSIIMGLLFIFFELLILSAIIRGISLVNCGCFGSAGSNSITLELFQNLIILCFVFLAYKFGEKFSIDNWLKNKFIEKTK
jgi:putative oxidoreductase